MRVTEDMLGNLEYEANRCIAAAPGGWTADVRDVWAEDGAEIPWGICTACTDISDDVTGEWHAAYIAAAQPKVVLAMIARIRELERLAGHIERRKDHRQTVEL